MEQQQTQEEPKRIIVNPEDLSVLTGKSIKTSRNMLTRIRKDLDKKPGTWLTYRDIAQYFNWDEGWVRSVLYVNYFIVLVWGFYLWIFRDDMDLAVNLIAVYVVWKLYSKSTFKILREGWREIFHK